MTAAGMTPPTRRSDLVTRRLAALDPARHMARVDMGPDSRARAELDTLLSTPPSLASTPQEVRTLD